MLHPSSYFTPPGHILLFAHWANASQPSDTPIKLGTQIERRSCDPALIEPNELNYNNKKDKKKQTETNGPKDRQVDVLNSHESHSEEVEGGCEGDTETGRRSREQTLSQLHTTAELLMLFFCLQSQRIRAHTHTHTHTLRSNNTWHMKTHRTTWVMAELNRAINITPEGIVCVCASEMSHFVTFYERKYTFVFVFSAHTLLFYLIYEVF